MTQDLEQYREIIEQLKPMVNEPEFNQVLAQVAKDVSKEKRFLIKMELKRLARPCIRLIDLRGQVDGECRLFEYDGRSHYLDDIAIDVFERQVRLFGEYTIGVYEAVTSTENNFRVMFKRQFDEQQSTEPDEPAEQDPGVLYQVPVVTLNDFPQRFEERMNYAVSVEIFNDNKRSTQASTVDLSVNGLRIKVTNEHSFQLGERLIVHFRGLETEYSLDKRQGIPYGIVAIEQGDKDQKISLRRLNEIDTEAFDAFLKQFIHGNKRRYKVNMDNTLFAIQNKTYEQYFTPSFPSVPVYLEKLEDHYRPRYLMKNDCNKDTIHYWTDEQNELRLGYLLNDRRIKTLLTKPEGLQQTLVYTFNHLKDEKVYFYSATMEELQANPNLQSVYLGFGSRKASWRIFTLQLTPVSTDDAHVPLSLPDSVSESIRKQNQPPTPRLMARLKHVQQLALVTDVTDSVGLDTYQKMPIRRDELAKLRIFCHPRNKPPAPIIGYRFKYRDLRKETRYQLRSSVMVSTEGMEFAGVSEDVSVHGLRVELETFFHQSINSRVNLTFPQLQKVTRKYNLSDLQYRVKNISNDGCVIHLQAIANDENTTAQRFFDELIRNNRSKLKAYQQEEEIPGIGQALRNIYARNQLNGAFFIKKEGVSFPPEAASITDQNSRLAHLLAHDADPGNVNLRFLYQHDGNKRNFVADCMSILKANEQPLMRELFIAFDPSQQYFEQAVTTEFSEHFRSDRLRHAYIQSALNRGQFIALKVFVARTGRPDTENMLSEIKYVSVYAVHRAKILEEQIWNIAGVCNLLDVTDEVMFRYGFSQSEIADNHRPPQKTKVATSDIEELLKA